MKSKLSYQYLKIDNKILSNLTSSEILVNYVTNQEKKMRKILEKVQLLTNESNVMQENNQNKTKALINLKVVKKQIDISNSLVELN